MDDPCADWQLLADHLREVARLAEQFAREAGADEVLTRRARALGLLHDIGKYSAAFQKLLKGEVKKAPHSVFGAFLASARGHAPDIALAIAGHHAGMPDPAALADGIAKAPPESDEIVQVAIRDCPEIGDCFQDKGGLLGRLGGDGLKIDCSTRVLFSCLIDADRIDAARHGGAEICPTRPLKPSEQLERLLHAIEKKSAGMPDGAVKSARARVLAACLAGASSPGPLFSLTVPTGGGKTLSSMAFALQRAKLYPDQLRRIVVVIPYLSIIEQNARVYREALGDDAILEHHSGIWGMEGEADEGYLHPALRLATENWNAPIVITTSVRFFEALFSNKPKDLRRMHNLARSVVILDEVQTLPRGRVAPILSMMQSMAKDWKTVFVFCTATQPAFEKSGKAGSSDPRWPVGALHEIIPEPKKLFAALRRVQVEWPAPGEKKTWDELALEVADQRQALIVVNTRRHALKLFHLLRGSGPHVYHLSNNMCPGHRLFRLDEVRARLQRGEACVLVSTQLVEAGVDIDFPAVWRAMGPLDSIAQSAGRCDREGRLTATLERPGGRVVVFQPEDDEMPGGDYREAAGITAALAAGGGLTIDDPGLIRTYFDRYYDVEALDSDDIEESRRKLKFATVADGFRMIEDNCRGVIVPYDEAADAMLKSLRFGSLAVLRRLQRYTISLWPNDFRKGVSLGVIYNAVEGKEIWAARKGFYDMQTGLRLEPESGQMVI